MCLPPSQRDVYSRDKTRDLNKRRGQEHEGGEREKKERTRRRERRKRKNKREQDDATRRGRDEGKRDGGK